MSHIKIFTFTDWTNHQEHSFPLDLHIDQELLHELALTFCETEDLESRFGVHDGSGGEHEYGWSTEQEIQPEQFPELMKIWRDWFIDEFGPSAVTGEITTRDLP